MKKLNGHLYLVPVRQKDTGELGKDTPELMVRRFISSLLGLNKAPEKWVKVCAHDEDAFDGNGTVQDGKSADWCGKGYKIDGKDQPLPFPEFFPAELFMGKMENDTVTFPYGEIEVTVVLKQLPSVNGNLCFEEILTEMIKPYFEKGNTGTDAKIGSIFGFVDSNPDGQENSQQDEGVLDEEDAAAEKEETPCAAYHKEGLPTGVKVTLCILGGLTLLGGAVALGSAIRAGKNSGI
jgi:hypothetical protein